MTARGFVQGIALARDRLSAFSRSVSTTSNKVTRFGARLAVVGATKFAALSNAIKRGTTQLARFARGFIEFGKRIARVIMQLAKYIALIAVAGVALAGIYIRRTMQAVDVTAKMADRLGIAIEDLQRFRHAAALSGMAVGKMDLSLMQFVRRIGEAQQGLTTYSRAFDQVGLDIRTMATLDLAEAFKQAIEGIRGLEQDTLKASVAYNMFGRQGQTMINLIAAGRKGLEEMGTAVDKAGAAINRIDAAKIEMANDAITTAVLSAQAFWQQLTVHLVAPIKAAADWMFDLSTETIKTGAIMERVFNNVGRVVGGLADTFKVVYETLLEMNIRMYALLSTTARLLGQTDIADRWMALGKAAVKMKRELQALEGAWGGKIQIAWDRIVASADKLAQAIAKNREEMRLARKVGEGVANTIADLQKRAEALVKSLRDPWQVLTDSIEDYRKMLSMLFIDENTYLRAVAKAWEVYYKTIEKVKDGLRALADPARLRFAPATIAGTAEAVRTQWRATRGVIGAATVAVQQQQLKIQQGIGETAEEMKEMLRRGLRLEDVAVLDVVA